MDNEDDIMNENMNEEDYLSEEEDDDEEFDINAGNLPAFANAENRSLSKALEDKEAQVELLAREAEENEERVKVMSEHLKHVKQELLHTQRLVEAKNKECKTRLKNPKLDQISKSPISFNIRLLVLHWSQKLKFKQKCKTRL